MMIKFNKINSKKIVAVMLSCFVLLQTGCTKKEAAASQKEYMKNSKIEQSVQNLNDEIEISDYNNPVVEEDTSTYTQEEKDEYIIDYVTRVSNKVDEILESETVSNIKAKSKIIFVNLVDFVFYNGEIHGITFDELSDSAKNKVMEITLSMDSKIESKIPGYKEKIKDKSGKYIEYSLEKMKTIKDSVEQKLEEKIGQQEYNDMKEDLKERVNETKDITKDLYEKGKEKLKTWYEGWR